MKKTRTKPLIILSVLAFTSICLCLYAWARYRSSIPNSTSASIAKWNFDLQTTDGDSMATVGPIDLADTLDFDHVAEKKVAPGTRGQFQMVVDTTGTETQMQYEIEIDLTNCPQNLEFYKNSNLAAASKIVKDNNKLYLKKFLTAEQAKVYTETITIYWNWPYQTGVTNADIAANDIIDNQSQGKTVYLDITAKGTEMLKSVDYARDILVVNPAGATAEAKSPYVLYPAKGVDEGVICRVAYNAVGDDGPELITEQPLGTIVLGNTDPKFPDAPSYKDRAILSYNNMVATLNEYAEDYLDELGLAKDARSVGSVPKNKNSESGYFDGGESYANLNNKFKDNDTNYLTDKTQLESLDLWTQHRLLLASITLFKEK